jgi:hypothetical protein
MIGNVAVEPQSTEPAVRQIEVDFLAQPTLRTNAVAVAVADNQHAHHQLGINRGPPDVAIVGPQVRTNLGQVDEPVDLSQQMIIGNAPLQTEAVKQRLLHHPLFAHHRPNLPRPGEENQRPRLNQAEFFDTIRP